MAFRQVRVSDLTGNELADSDVVTVVVKQAGKVFDAARDELVGLKPVTNVQELEYRFPSGEVQTVLVSKVEFSKLVPDEKLETFDSSRGRRSGFSPKNGA
jgi:hypothetical protein